MEQTRYGISITTALDFHEAEARVRASLAEQGFGILTEIDVAATLAAKLGVTRRPYKILGACNPPLADRALQAEPGVGLLLPCNVVVYESDAGTVVAAVDPNTMKELTDNPEIDGVAAEARASLEKALSALEA